MQFSCWIGVNPLISRSIFAHFVVLCFAIFCKIMKLSLGQQCCCSFKPILLHWIATHFLKYLINWQVNRNFQYRTVLMLRVSAQSTNFGRKSPPPKVFSKSAISINIHSSLMGGLTPGSAPVLSPSNSPSTSPTKPSSPPLQENLPPVSANKVCIDRSLVSGVHLDQNCNYFDISVQQNLVLIIFIVVKIFLLWTISSCIKYNSYCYIWCHGKIQQFFALATSAFDLRHGNILPWPCKVFDYSEVDCNSMTFGY